MVLMWLHQRAVMGVVRQPSALRQIFHCCIAKHQNSFAVFFRFVRLLRCLSAVFLREYQNGDQSGLGRQIYSLFVAGGKLF